MKFKRPLLTLAIVLWLIWVAGLIYGLFGAALETNADSLVMTNSVYWPAYMSNVWWTNMIVTNYYGPVAIRVQLRRYSGGDFTFTDGTATNLIIYTNYSGSIQVGTNRYKLRGESLIPLPR